MPKVVGLDGCKTGWIAAIAVDRRLIAIEHFGSAQAALEAHADAAVFAIDIPIGLSEVDKRAADSAARKFLPGRKSVVFAPPARFLFTFPNREGSYRERYRRANAASKQICGKGLAAQAFGLLPKIIEVNSIAEDSRVYEAHPEVSFAELSGGQLLPPKKTPDGLIQRKELLRAAGLVIPDQLGVAGARGAPDDIVDAVACAWTAGRIANGEARKFPDPPEPIGGRDVAIWC